MKNRRMSAEQEFICLKWMHMYFFILQYLPKRWVEWVQSELYDKCRPMFGDDKKAFDRVLESLRNTMNYRLRKLDNEPNRES